MTNYTITQCSKGGRTTARLNAAHEAEVTYHLVNDGIATPETGAVVERRLASVTKALRAWGTDEAKRIRLSISSATLAQADEWLLRAEDIADELDEARKVDASLRDAEREAFSWVVMMQRVRYVVLMTEALRAAQERA
jgi:hypothetical protein